MQGTLRISVSIPDERDIHPGYIAQKESETSKSAPGTLAHSGWQTWLRGVALAGSAQDPGFRSPAPREKQA